MARFLQSLFVYQAKFESTISRLRVELDDAKARHRAEVADLSHRLESYTASMRENQTKLAAKEQVWTCHLLNKIIRNCVALREYLEITRCSKFLVMTASFTNDGFLWICKMLIWTIWCSVMTIQAWSLEPRLKVIKTDIWLWHTSRYSVNLCMKWDRSLFVDGPQLSPDWKTEYELAALHALGCLFTQGQLKKHQKVSIKIVIILGSSFMWIIFILHHLHCKYSIRICYATLSSMK